ncbi:pseudouridine synthase [Dokdonia sp. Hel_I_53]|uniref:pseudouridine synthase n=1 Tax=Dokdonia sp. Hel_I_53 TaxID=1566287 RepID=UPI00119B55DF|nr:pseudouridine synthase [Dokdonia sp. Hel_I_53]TVZ51435.1 23S rRNA pseudouridine2457 synthase [Dokdonia sp. Hel_I_53]
MPLHKHFKLYKPYGYISQMLSNDERQSRKKKFLSDLYPFPMGVMAIGRLDEKSEGLLLLTTDGKLSDMINRSGVEKEYYAQVDGQISDKEIKKLKEGVTIGVNGKKYLTKPCKVHIVDSPQFPDRSKKIRDSRHGPTSWISIIIKEGKYRQVRKMTSAVGFPTLRLVRIRIGSQTLKDLEPSQVISVKKLI